MESTHDDERELAQAILTGAHRRPGAIVWLVPSALKVDPAHSALPSRASISCPTTHTTRCRSGWTGSSTPWRTSGACPAGCKKQIPIGAMIVHLNDDHRWTREQIAE